MESGRSKVGLGSVQSQALSPRMTGRDPLHSSRSPRLEGSTTPTSLSTGRRTVHSRTQHRGGLFQATTIVNGTVAESFGLKDLAAVASLKKEMNDAQAVQDELTQLVSDSAYLMSSYHGTHALENVATYRNTEELADEIQRKEEIIRRRKKEVEIAELEHRRLEEENRRLLNGVRDKGKERSRVLVKLETHKHTERKVTDFGGSIAEKTTTYTQDKSAEWDRTQVTVAMIGDHHGEVMLLEQELIDLTLEAELLRGKLGITNKGTQKHSSEWYFRACDNAQCIKDRAHIRAAKERAKQLEMALNLQFGTAQQSFVGSVDGGSPSRYGSNLTGGGAETPSVHSLQASTPVSSSLTLKYGSLYGKPN